MSVDPAGSRSAPGWLPAAPVEELAANAAEVRRLVAAAADALANGDRDLAVLRAECAALSATWRHAGCFADEELEALLRDLGRAYGSPQAAARPLGSDGPRRVLHVATWSMSMGGLSRLVARWVALDRGRRHSVALTRQRSTPIPTFLTEAVARAGGDVVALDRRSGTAADLVHGLRDMAGGHDLVVLHVETDDVLPAVAFHAHVGPPVALVNHADHAFWAGAGACDVVINLRHAGAELTALRRGIPSARNVVLPTPLAPGAPGADRAAARQALGLDDDAVVLLSVARPPKFVPHGAIHFADLLTPVLSADSRVVLYAVGPDDDPRWRAAVQRFGPRVSRIPATPDTAGYLAAADVYVDSHPFVSITSMLEAGAQGLPLVSFSPHTAQSSIFESSAPGLVGCVLTGRDPVEHAGHVLDLVRSERRRADLGRRTAERIRALHTGEGWLDELEGVYRTIAQMPPVDPATPVIGTPCTGEPDRFMPTVFGAPVDVEEHLASRLGMLPVRPRLAQWRALRRTHPVPVRALVPQAVKGSVRNALTRKRVG